MTSTSKQRRSRTERKKQGRLVLTNRDKEIIHAVYRFRFLTSRQLTEMFFPSKSKADRRLRELYDHGYVDRIERPVMQGKAELIYALWKEGAHYLAEDQGIPKNEFQWKPSRNSVKPERLQHELDIVSFHLTMDRSVNLTDGVSWLFWKNRQEITSKKSWDLINVGRSKGGKLKIIPDAFFGLQTPRGKTIFFVEIDRATEAGSSVFRNKLLAYQHAFERGAVQKATGFKTFRVLTITINEKRHHYLLDLAKLLRHPLLFWFTTMDKLESNNNMINPVWQVANKPKQYVPLYSR